MKKHRLEQTPEAAKFLGCLDHIVNLIAADGLQQVLRRAQIPTELEQLQQSIYELQDVLEEAS